MQSGELHSPDRSPVFHITALLFRYLGDSENSLFIFGFLTYAFLAICRWIAASVLSKKGEGISWFPYLAGVWISFLYPKQAWGLGFFTLGFALLRSVSLSEGPKAKRVLSLFLSLLFFGVATLFHSLFVVLSIVAILGISLDRIVFIRRWKRDKVAVFCMVLTGLAFLVLDQGQNFDFGARFEKDPGRNWPILEAYRIYGPSLVLEWCLVLFLSWRDKNSAFPFLVLAILLFPWASFPDLQFRLLLVFLWIGELSLPPSKEKYAIGIFVFLLWAAFLVRDKSHFSHSYPKFRKSLSELPKEIRPGLLVAHHGFCEFIKFHRETDCLSWKPDEKAKRELPPGSEIYRIVADFSKRELESAFLSDGEKVFRDSVLPLGEYLLVNEKDWDLFRATKEKEKDESTVSRILSWKNPYRERPAFILQKYGSSEPKPK